MKTAPSHPYLGHGLTGVIIVDHGSRRAESNELLLKVVDLYRTHAAESAGYRIIEPAHMEIAEPSIATAFGKCVEKGAKRVIVMPYFLLPGKHWDRDIPHLTSQAAKSHPGVEFIVAAPLGLHPLIAQVIEARIDHCLAHAIGGAPECDVCQGTGRCKMKQSGQA